MGAGQPEKKKKENHGGSDRLGLSGRERVGPKVTPRSAAGMVYPRTLSKPTSRVPARKKNQKEKEICLDVRKANPMKAG